MPCDILKRKSQTFRSHCLERAKKSRHDKSTIPMPKDIAEWLERQPQIEKHSQLYFSCYLTNKLIPMGEIELDHRIPIARGGNYSLDNLGVTDARINQAKGVRTETEFKDLLGLIANWDDKGKTLLADLVRGAGAFGLYK